MMVITRGITPTIRFKLPFETDVIQNCEVYLSQPNLLMTDDETLQMSTKHPLEMQIRFKYTNGSLGATRIKQGDVGTDKTSQNHGFVCQFTPAYDKQFCDNNEHGVYTPCPVESVSTDG